MHSLCLSPIVCSLLQNQILYPHHPIRFTTTKDPIDNHHHIYVYERQGILFKSFLMYHLTITSISPIGEYLHPFNIHSPSLVSTVS